MSTPTKALWIGATLLLAGEMTAGADPYREAHQLLLRAEAMFQLHRIDDALGLMNQALARQRRQGKPYGYARYVYFRRAKHLVTEGKPARARTELIRALKITEGQQRVAEQFRFTRHHPFIVKHFPRLAGFAWRRYSPNEVAPAERLHPAGGGRFIYAVGKRAVFRLDRRAGTRLKLHEARRGEIVAFSAAGDHRRSAAVIARGSRHELHTLQLDPFEQRVVSVPARPLALALRDGGVVLFERLNRTLRVLRLFDARNRRTRLSVRGMLLHGSAEHLLYGTWARRRHLLHAIYYQSLAATGSRPQQLYRFQVIDRRNHVLVTPAASGSRFALFVRDVARNQRHVVTYDAKSGTRRASRHKIALIAPAEPAAAFSHDEDYLVLLQRLGGVLRVFRMTLAGSVRPLATISTPKASKVHGLGVTRDNQRIWLHLGDKLLLIDPQRRKQRSVRLAGRGGWTGNDHYFADPEQWFVGIKRPGQPSTFMVIAPKTLLSR